jgi:CTP synthase
MRLGAYPCVMSSGSHSFAAYQQTEISERHRHRYEFNREYEETLVANGMKIVGISPDNNFVEVVEVEGHPWFVGCQFHPEFKSKPLTSHPLFKAFVQASSLAPAENWLGVGPVLPLQRLAVGCIW